MRDENASAKTTIAAAIAPSVVELPMQRASREFLLEGMCGIIRRMTRVSPSGILCLVDHDERELSVELFSYLEGVRRYE